MKSCNDSSLACGVAELHSALVAKYAEKKYVETPPTEEELRYVVTEYVRLWKPRTEKRVFRPTQNPPVSPESPNRAWSHAK